MTSDMPDEFAIPQSECIKYHTYKLHSRNLVVGVWNGVSGFVGIREKFTSLYLFTEYHYDTGPPCGTATPFEDLGICPITDLKESHSQEWKGDGSDPEWATPTYKYSLRNEPLFTWLEQIEREAAIPCAGCKQPYYPYPWNDDDHCMRRDCWTSRCAPCPTCEETTPCSDGTVLCSRCADPLAYDLATIKVQDEIAKRWPPKPVS